MDNQYTGDNIKILSDIEHIKLRKGMYIGEANNPHHLFSEIYDNALDEVMNGFSDKVDIYIDTKTNSYSIRDYGRGLPQDKKIMPSGEVKLTMDIIFTKNNAGGKFDDGSYKISSGLHGVGSTVTNALSSNLQVSSFRNGKMLSIIYENSIKKDVIDSETNEPDGTLVKFIPDKSMFESESIPIDFIKQRCMISTAFGLKTSLYIDNVLQKDIETTSVYDLISEDEDISVYDSFNSEVNIDGEYVKFALRYTSDTNCRSKGFTNLLPNPQGGTHIWMLEKAIENAWSRFKVEDVWTKDFFLGLRFISAVFISETDFNGQTKEKLTVPKKALEKYVNPIADKIYEWLKSNDELRNALIKRFQDYRASMNKLLSKKEIRDLIVINKDTSGNVRRKTDLDSKLKECRSKVRDNTELLIVEGDSAAGPLIEMRNLQLQAILPLRGKLINASTHDIVRLMKNQEIRSLVNGAGTGILEECDVSRSRYARYIICTDADEDGKNIASQVVSSFVNLLPGIVKAGMLYVAVPPLYGWYEGSEFKYSNNVEDIPKNLYESHKFQRFKGLGQMNSNEIYTTLLDSSTRQLMRIEYPDNVDDFNNVMSSASVKYDILIDMGLIKYI